MELENPSAFPIQIKNEDNYRENFFNQGMTLRDYFAGKAMTSSAAEFYNFHRSPDEYQKMAETSYKLADAMLKERIK